MLKLTKALLSHLYGLKEVAERPRVDPCGAPQRTFNREDSELFMDTNC